MIEYSLKNKEKIIPIKIKIMPNPVGFEILWELLTFGISKKYFLKNGIEKLILQKANIKDINIVKKIIINSYIYKILYWF